MPVQIGASVRDFSDPTGLLSDCHRRVEMFIGALSKIGELGDRPLTQDERNDLDRALRYFREAAPKHTADEEESLFPRLRSMSDPDVQSALEALARLEEEHRWAAPLHAQVERIGQQWLADGRLSSEQKGRFRSAIAELAAMYRAHIEVEERLVFPLAARILSRDEKSAIAEEMADRRSFERR
ncbi:MAG TPA: hemerythrin domain-containing protein [Terriglobales bacterium]|jgi:hemerythrin-like domain-containing protein|nr:hemerythrin domain-containing protein [Terriglobales bacterium]